MNCAPFSTLRGRSTPRPRKVSGFTLVELLISMVLGLFIVLALLTLLINVNRNNSEMTKANRLIENGRFALQLLTADAELAGFLGGFVPQFDDLTNVAVPGDVPAAVPNPCLGFASWDAAHVTNLMGIPVQAYEIPATVPSPALPVCAASPTWIVRDPQPGSDVLVLRHLEPCKAGVDAGCAAPPLPGASGAPDIYLQAGRCTDDLHANYTTRTFTIGTPKTTTNGLGVSTSTFALGPGTTSTQMPLHERNCTAPAPAYKYLSTIYYLRNYAVNPGDGVPTLMRSQFANGAQQAGEAVIEGIEGLRVEIGIDDLSDSGSAVNFGAAVNWADPSNLVSPTNRGDGIPDGYVRCTAAAPCTASQLQNAVAVKIFALVRSENRTAGYTDTKTYCLASNCVPADRVGPFNDGFKRHLFTQTVRLVNVSARRETP